MLWLQARNKSTSTLWPHSYAQFLLAGPRRVRVVAHHSNNSSSAFSISSLRDSLPVTSPGPSPSAPNSPRL